MHIHVEMFTKSLCYFSQSPLVAKQAIFLAGFTLMQISVLFIPFFTKDPISKSYWLSVAYSWAMSMITYMPDLHITKGILRVSYGVTHEYLERICVLKELCYVLIIITAVVEDLGTRSGCDKLLYPTEYCVGGNYLFMTEITASDTKVLV